MRATEVWPFVHLEDLLVSRRDLTYGIVQPGSEVSGGVPIVRVRDVRNGSVNTTAPLHVDPDIEKAYERSRLRGGELLVTLVGTVGETAVAGPELAGWNVARAVAVARLKPEVGARWVTWAMKLSASAGLIAERLNTTVQATLNLADLREIPIPLPPELERRAIAATLGALDDKIESNQRAGQLLDELARSIFRRWRAYSAPGGETTLGSFADVYGGATPKTSIPKYWGGPLAWTTPTDVTALSSPYLFSTRRTITSEGLASCAAALHPTNTIFMTSRATIGAFALNQVPAATNQGFIAIRPKREIDRWFLFEEMRLRVPEFIDNANGSTFLEISRGRFKELPLRVPSDQALSELQRMVEPLHTKAARLTMQSSQLATLRDTLLPELLSGRIRVDQVDQHVSATEETT